VEGHRNDEIKGLIARDCRGEVCAKRPGERPYAAVFKKMDEIAQDAIVGAEGIGGVEAEQPAAAELATSFRVERRGVQERRAAGDAEKLGGKRLGLGEALGADRNAGEIAQRCAADTAIIGE
jgi:hypothetical protein